MEFQRKSKERRFGLSYMGSKSRFWRWLLQRMPACGTFYDLFAGGCSVGHMKSRKEIVDDMQRYPHQFERLKRTVAKIAETSKVFPNDPKAFLEWWLSGKSVEAYKLSRLPFPEVAPIVDLSFK